MLLAEELALVAVKPESGRHDLGTGGQLNACLAGLLVAELVLDGTLDLGDAEDRIVVLGASPTSPTAAGDGPLDLGTAVALSMTGPAQPIEVVAPSRASRRHARQRIDHAPDGTHLAPVGEVVRRLIREAAAASGV